MCRAIRGSSSARTDAACALSSDSWKVRRLLSTSMRFSARARRSSEPTRFFRTRSRSSSGSVLVRMCRSGPLLPRIAGIFEVGSSRLSGSALACWMRRRSAIRLRSGLACLSRSSYSLIRVPCQLMSSTAGSWMPSIVASSDWMDRIGLSISCSVRYWFCPCWGWASSAISASMANEELRALVLQFFPRRPSRVPEEGRVVGGGTLIGGCAKLRRVRVRSAWSEDSGEAFALAGGQGTEQQRCLLGADADNICAFVDGERRRPVFHQRRLHPAHAAELAGVVAAETAAGDSRVGAGELAAEGVGGD